LAKPNYQFEKRQRDLAKKRKQEEKRQRKLAAKASPAGGSTETLPEQPDSTLSNASGDGRDSSAGGGSATGR